MATDRKERNRNFLPAFLLTLVWWGLLGFVVIKVDPDVVADFPIPGSFGIFFGLLFLSLWFTASLLLANTRRGILVAIGGVIWGYLRIWHLGNLLNTFLLIGLLGAFELYVTIRKTPQIDK